MAADCCCGPLAARVYDHYDMTDETIPAARRSKSVLPTRGHLAALR